MDFPVFSSPSRARLSTSFAPLLHFRATATSTMSRFSRHLLNLTLLLIAVSSHFELHEFFILVASGGHLRDMVHVFVKLVWSLVFYALIQGVYNVANLGYPIKAILSVMLWVAVGRSCAICDGIYSDYLSAPANGILSRLSYIILSEKYRKAASVFMAVYSWKMTRLIAQWSLFSYFFKTHRSNDDMITKKYNSTVILPMADTESRRVEECLTSCLLIGMRNVVVVTSKDIFADVEKRMESFRSKFQRSVIQVVGTYEVEKSNMIVEGLRHVKTDLVVLVDPNVFWPHRFLDRLLESLSDQVGFAMLYQRVRRFKLPFKEVNTLTSSAQAEAARAIVIRLRALRFQAFRTSFREVQRANGFFYDEERSAHFLERLALEKGYSTLKGYAGYDAFEPPAHTAEEPAKGTHLIFNVLRYIRQAFRMTFSDLLVTAAHWTKMPSISYTSHAAAFFVSAFVFDCLMTAIITLVQRPQDWTLFIFGLKAEKPQVHGQQRYDPERLLRFHYIFGWCHGLVKIWAGMYLVLNFFGETDISFDSQDPRTVFCNRDDGHAPSSPSSAGSGISKHGPGRSTTQNITVTTESTAFPRLPLRDQNTENTGRDRSDETPSPATRHSDPIQRVRNLPSYRPGTRPLPPRIQTVPAEGVGNTPTSAVQSSRALSPIQTGQTRKELSPSLPNTPIERSQLREAISLAAQGTQTSSRSPHKHEQPSFSRSPSPRTKARAQIKIGRTHV